MVLASIAGASLASAQNAAAGNVAAAPTSFGAASDAAGATNPKNFLTYSADAGIGYSDNISETSVDKRSDEMLAVGVQLAGLEQSARFEGAVLGDLEHLNYLQGTYGPQVIGNFAGSGSYALVPNFVHWMAQDSFGQGLVDPFASESPGNTEYINTFTTGPTFTIPLGVLTLLDVSARYSRVTYQVSPLDSNDYGGSVSLTHLLSARSRISLNLQSERYEFTDPFNPSYDQREAFARYDIQGARTHIVVDGGFDQIRGSQLSSNGALARLNVSRTVAEGSVVSLSAGREPSNSAAFLAQNQGVSGIGLQTTAGVQSATPFTNQYATVGWSFSRRRTTLGLTLAHYNQIYVGHSQLDQSYTSAGVRASRIVYPGWTVSAFFDYTKQTFAQQVGNGNYTEERVGTNAVWQMSRKLALTFEYDHYNRDSELALYTFSENRVWLRLRYGTSGLNGVMGGGNQASAMSVINTDRFNIPAPSH
jgi:hypothetical protein